MFITDATSPKLKKGQKGPDEALRGRGGTEVLSPVTTPSSSELDLQVCAPRCCRAPGGSSRMEAVWRLLCSDGVEHKFKDKQCLAFTLHEKIKKEGQLLA